MPQIARQRKITVSLPTTILANDSWSTVAMDGRSLLLYWTIRVFVVVVVVIVVVVVVVELVAALRWLLG